MSSDTSPPSEYRLENPARTAGAIGGPPSRRVPITEPSWIKVIGTTLRLFVRRRILRVPDARKIDRARKTAVTAVAAVLVVAVAGAVFALTLTPASHHAAQSRATRPALTRAQKQARAAAARALAANTTAAATWIATEVSEHAVIGCDPATCAAIQQAGYATAGEVVLRPGVQLPGAGAVVVATPAVTAQYGTQLAATAPEVIAAFGTGPEVVQVRVAVAGGQAAATSAIAARRSAAASLLANRRVHIYPSARQDLTAGLVDPRLLTALQRLAAGNSVDIYAFADKGPAADSSTPYRLVEIIGMTSKHAVTVIVKQLQTLPNGLRPALAVVRAPAGNYGLTIRFKAPTPD